MTDLPELFPGVDGPDEELITVLTEADVDTVGGLLAQQLGKVPLPGAEAEVAGLAMLAEGGNDARGRVRITTVLVQPVDPEARQRVYGGDRNGVEANADSASRTTAESDADRREESDARFR